MGQFPGYIIGIAPFVCFIVKNLCLHEVLRKNVFFLNGDVVYC